MDSLAVVRYTRALLELADERGELDKTERDLTSVCTVVGQYPEIAHLVLNTTISQTEKEDFIDKIIPSEISRLVVQFIKVLIHKRRFEELDAIQKEFHQLYESKRGIKEVVAITAVPISGQHQNRLTSVLKKKLNSEIRLTNDVDPKILGGMVLRFNHIEIDGSYSNQLAELKQHLKK